MKKDILAYYRPLVKRGEMTKDAAFPWLIALGVASLLAGLGATGVSMWKDYQQVKNPTPVNIINTRPGYSRMGIGNNFDWGYTGPGAAIGAGLGTLWNMTKKPEDRSLLRGAGLGGLAGGAIGYALPKVWPEIGNYLNPSK